MDMRAGWKGPLIVAAEDVECCASEKVVGRIEVDVLSANTSVRYGTIQRVGRHVGFIRVYGDANFKVHGQSKTDDIEARAYSG